MGSVDKRPSGRYRARWRETPNGAQKSEHFDRKIDAKNHITEMEAKLLSGDYVDPSLARKTTFEGFAEGWTQSQAWRGSTQDRNRSILKRHLYPSFGAQPLAAVRPTEIREFLRGLESAIDEHGKPRFAPSYIEGIYRLLAAVFAAAVTDRYLARSPAAGVQLKRREGTMLVPLERQQVVAISEVIDKRLKQAVIFDSATGLRQGELFGLTIDRVNFLKRELVVDRQMVSRPGAKPGFGPCKTARSVRTVPLADHAVEALARQLDEFKPGDHGLIFHREDQPWPRPRAGEEFAKARPPEINGGAWHMLRDFCASTLIAQGLSVTAVAAILGHSPAECLSSYAGWWPSEHDLIRRAMDRAWKSTPESRLSPASPSQT